MESKKSDFSRKVMGATIAVIAIAMMFFDYFAKESAESSVMPIILFALAAIIFAGKPKKEVKKIDISTKKGIIILSISSLVLVAGIVTFFITIL